MATRGIAGDDPFSSDEVLISIWKSFVEKAEGYNAPGRLRAMTGFEWTSSPDANNLHRVVVLGDGADETSQIVPYSMFDSANPEKRWDQLARYEDGVGGRAVAIPHNGNLSKGLMLSDKDLDQPAPRGKAPRFMVRALRDPDGANLDRVRIIKGWIDEDGKSFERLYDVAASGERKIGRDGRAKTSVGSTVDIERATFTNTIGAATLSGYWEDPGLPCPTSIRSPAGRRPS